MLGDTALSHESNVGRMSLLSGKKLSQNIQIQQNLLVVHIVIVTFRPLPNETMKLKLWRCKVMNDQDNSGMCRCFKYSAFQIDELHRHNQNLVGRLHKGVPTVVDRHKKCCKRQLIRTQLCETSCFVYQGSDFWAQQPKLFIDWARKILL